MDVSSNWNDHIARMSTAEVNAYARSADRRLAEAVAAERERCAVIAEGFARRAGSDRQYMLKGPALWLRDVAQAIRSTPERAAQDDGAAG